MSKVDYDKAEKRYWDELVKQQFHYAKLLLANPATRKAGIAELDSIMKSWLKQEGLNKEIIREVRELHSQIQKIQNFVHAIKYDY